MEKFKLPDKTLHEIIVNVEPEDMVGQISLLPTVAQTLNERRQARRSSLKARVKVASELVNQSDEQWLVWCDLNDESSELSKSINGSVEVRGTDTNDHKENSMLDFAQSEIKALVTKPSIAGYGMNWQNCRNMIFIGLSDSYEMLYQAIRRCWRFGQERPVNVYMVISEQEERSKPISNGKKKNLNTCFSKWLSTQKTY